MPEPVANDYTAILARWREIKAEAHASQPKCPACDGVGWVNSAAALYITAYVECPECRNALDAAKPG